jgi:Zn-dependent peptidase ImmA (M78 family)
MMAVQKMLIAIEWPEVSLPTLSLGIDVGTEEEAAALVRAKYHAPRGPIESVSAILEQAGVMVIPESSSHSEMDGTSVWRSDLPPMIFVNQHATQDRMRFTMLHETGHLVLHQRSVLSQVSDNIEEQAHRFASAFLMPADEIKPQLRNLTISKLADLKRHWRVAMSALVMRAKQLDVITPTEATYLWRELSKRGWMKREPEQLDVRGESPGQLFTDLVTLHLTDLGYRGRKFEDFINLEHEDVYSQIMPESLTPRLRIVERTTLG